MEQSSERGQPMTAQEFTDALVRIGLIAVVVVMCFRVFSPFMTLMIWAVILAVTLYPLHQALTAKVGKKHGWSATIMVLIGLVLLGVPVAMLGSIAAQNLMDIHLAYVAGTLTLPEPGDSVAEWPLIGDKVYDAWSAAAANLPEFIEENKTTLEAVATSLFDMAKSSASGILMFLGALIVSGIMMAYGQGGSQAILSIMNRIAGTENGPDVHTLVTMTTRSVAVGVLGVALIQSVLMGVGFVLAGVPLGGLLALIVMLLAIMQLPALLVGIPVIMWVWNSSDASSTMTVVWTIYFLATAASDNALKPLLLGRGVDAPMPVILIGALGGMISSGFIGLFTGAVILTVGYQVFMRWVAANVTEPQPSGGEAETPE